MMYMLSQIPAVVNSGRTRSTTQKVASPSDFCVVRANGRICPHADKSGRVIVEDLLRVTAIREARFARRVGILPLPVFPPPPLCGGGWPGGGGDPPPPRGGGGGGGRIPTRPSRGKFRAPPSRVSVPVGFAPSGRRPPSYFCTVRANSRICPRADKSGLVIDEDLPVRDA